MNWFNNLGTSAKLLIGFGLVVALIAVLGITSRLAMDSMERGSRIAVQAAALENSLNEDRAVVLTMLNAAADPADRPALMREVRDNARKGETLIDSIRKLSAGDAALLGNVERFAGPYGEYIRYRHENTLALIEAGRLDEARNGSLSVQQERFLALRDAAQAMSDLAQQRNREEARKAAVASIVVFAVATLAALLVGILLARGIARPLQAITAKAERIATGELPEASASLARGDEVGMLDSAFARMTDNLREMAAAAERIAEGDLRVAVHPQSDRDVLGKAFASMVANLRQLTADLYEGINVLGASATEISASTSQLAAGATQTAAAVSETTTTVEEVRQTAEVSSQKARLVSESAQRVAAVSESGRRSTEDAAAGVARIQHQMETIAECMMRLSEQSQAVGQIVATVDDLAGQSKLLAVNASIEAAKAGEHGKGFAVVAQEVKSLAQQSREATAQVRSILGDIQQATSAAVLATEQGSHAVEEGARQSAQAGESIQALSGSVQEAAQAAVQIAASSQQQLVGVDQVASAMESIKLASTQNVDSARQLESAARNIKQLGERLRELAAGYRL